MKVTLNLNASQRTLLKQLLRSAIADGRKFESAETDAAFDAAAVQAVLFNRVGFREVKYTETEQALAAEALVVWRQL
jgi:hypothetical protein